MVRYDAGVFNQHPWNSTVHVTFYLRGSHRLAPIVTVSITDKYQIIIIHCPSIRAVCLCKIADSCRFHIFLYNQLCDCRYFSGSSYLSAGQNGCCIWEWVPRDKLWFIGNSCCRNVWNYRKFAWRRLRKCRCPSAKQHESDVIRKCQRTSWQWDYALKGRLTSFSSNLYFRKWLRIYESHIFPYLIKE